MSDKSLIRHMGKLKSIRANAQWINSLRQDYANFGEYLCSWNSEKTVDLWLAIKKYGSQLGGNSGPYFLRMAGKDTFINTSDVVAVLIREKVIDRVPTSKRDMYAAQDAFLQWQQQSGRPLCEISRIVALTVG